MISGGSFEGVSASRYEKMFYRRCGRSGLLLPLVSLGMWHNFGDWASEDTCRSVVSHAFDAGVTYFDLANNYGPPPGEAEKTFGRILSSLPRDEIVVATKAGYFMWPGPYGNWGSKKHLLASIDQSLRRLGLDYVDIFYHHRPDPDTPVEETVEALDLIVRQGKALYVAISNYDVAATERFMAAARRTAFATPIINQCRHNIFRRGVSEELLRVCERLGLAVVAYSPLAQGLLSDRYVDGIPTSSRAARKTWDGGDLKAEQVTQETIASVKELTALAAARGQSLAQMAISWCLRDRPGTTPISSVIIGPSSVAQLTHNIGAITNTTFGEAELEAIEIACRPRAA